MEGTVGMEETKNGRNRGTAGTIGTEEQFLAFITSVF